MRHTPGPWEVGDLDRNVQRVVRGKDIEICTCWHHGVGAIEKEMEGNAHLIAAAPALLEALQFLFQQLEMGVLVRDISHDNEPGWAVKNVHLVVGLKKAQQAIAQAKGE